MGRELDVRVAKALGQSRPPENEEVSWEPAEEDGGIWYGERQLRYDDGSWSRTIGTCEWPPYYSTAITAAVSLVGDAGKFYLERNEYGEWYALFGDNLDNGREAATACEAICDAFLAAKEAGDGAS